MKIIFSFKGSVFKQRDDISMEFEPTITVIKALASVVKKVPTLESLVFKNNTIRTDVVVLVEKMDVVTMNLLDMQLEDGQKITVLPLAHGG